MPRERESGLEGDRRKLTVFDLADLIGHPDKRLFVKTKSEHWYEIGQDKSGNENLLYVTSRGNPKFNGYMAISARDGKLISVRKQLHFYVDTQGHRGAEMHTITTTPIIEMVLLGEVD